jgi:anti-sigma B factor antagonist
MELVVEDMPSGITRAVLVGRMDIDGAMSVDLKLNVLAGAKKALIVDLGGVSFMASMGLRTLMLCAKAMSAKGRRMGVAGPQPNVEKVLRSSGADEVMDIYPTFEAASAAVVT